jgi:hypothetical protein
MAQSSIKRRTVAKGYSQLHGIDYDITYTPVVCLENLCFLLALVAALNLEVHQMDVDSAFLHAELTEEIYVTQPEGFKSTKYPAHVCHLLKACMG